VFLRFSACLRRSEDFPFAFYLNLSYLAGDPGFFKEGFSLLKILGSTFSLSQVRRDGRFVAFLIVWDFYATGKVSVERSSSLVLFLFWALAMQMVSSSAESEIIIVEICWDIMISF
jgi:hypothetical protein